MDSMDSVVVRDPEIMSGESAFRGSRVLVQTLFDYLEAAGYSLERFLQGFPNVDRQVHFSLSKKPGRLRRNQKISLRPNWICLDVVTVLVIRPAEELMAPLEKTIGLGEAKFAWFRELKNSARNCRLARSVTARLLTRRDPRW